ncbi:pyridoxal-phosphate-dependent aminotransferase family protein [Egicoccus halophilus]|uniref:Alanine--glyoxylate aminotransferase n=1 Tax=Egicoccus halophilus TaxID=1670830 RepID=A0A8J3ADP0_9ACTN|nr:alanine--glyoxylate aminotransferase family protein [Egicoccus halophilus]GGI06216.1 alanine--glyoxylate aminotransferase [Egicoccus halophilus]
MPPFPAATAPERLLLGAGPSPVDPRVLAAQAQPTVGHRDPFAFAVAEQVADMLRTVFRTRNTATLAVAGTGTAGMETAMLNLVEPGDTVIVGVNGSYGARVADLARRAGAEVVELEEPWGRAVPAERIESALRAHPETRVVALVHAETSTGVHQPLAEVGALLAGTEALFVVDVVTSLGGVPLEVDAWGIDAAYACTQGCLSVPPGLAPVTFSERAVDRLRQRATSVRSSYLDLTGALAWWGPEHDDHHAVPVNALLGLHEGLRIVLEEGLETRWARHAEVGELFQDHVQDRDAVLLADAGHRLPQLTTLAWPAAVDAATLRRRLLDEHGIEVAGGTGGFAERGWRVGLMGQAARHEVVDRLLDAVDELLEG